MAVLAWQRDQRHFLDECLVIPSEDVPRFAGEDAYGHFRFEFHPGSSTDGRLDAYRRNVQDLKAEIEGLLE